MNYNTEYFLNIEEKLIFDEISRQSNTNSFSFAPPTDEEIKEAHKIIHIQIVNTLISYYMERMCQGYDASQFSNLFEGKLTKLDIIPNDFSINTTPQLCELLHISFLNSTFVYNKNYISKKKSKSNLLESGAVYTQEQIAYNITTRTLKDIAITDTQNIKILDFATGTGRFYRQIIRCLHEIYGICDNDSVLNNIYAIDIDPIAINICRINAMSYLNNLDINKAKTVTSHILLRNALIKEQLFKDDFALSINDCNGLFYGGFNAIVSNPPYLVLKPNRNKMSVETIERINIMAKYFRTCHQYKYSIEGMLNLYQLSLEAMIGMLQQGGKMGIICPSTLFADISASTLRKYLLSQNDISYIRYFPEDEPLFDNITQATCIFHLTKGGTTNQIEISRVDKTYRISLADVKHIFKANWEIPSIEKVEWDILRKLHPLKTLKDHLYIRNRRGELDLSLYKEYITSIKTDFRLVRGNMISIGGLNDVNHEYVLPAFINKKSADYIKFDYRTNRIICKQISNQTQKRRLLFVLCERNDILGNSCNYLSVEEKYIPAVMALLNSALLNWRFKITSTNNHINNYELDELPIIDIDNVNKEILALVGKEKDRKICELYGLQNNEIEYIISQQYDIA